MKSMWMRWSLAVMVAGAALSPALFAAEDSAKTLPTLLIKGEVVSVDANDPAAVLLKVKDRYGFETPIYLTQETKIAQGDQILAVSDLAQGKAVEVEYNFDINTAKRHAVNVKVSAEVAQEPAAPAAETATEAPASALTPGAAAPSEAVAPSGQPAAQPEAAPASSAQSAAPSAPAEPTPASQPEGATPAGQTAQ